MGNKVYLYEGRNIEELSKEELIEALKISIELYEQLYRSSDNLIKFIDNSTKF